MEVPGQVSVTISQCVAGDGCHRAGRHMIYTKELSILVGACVQGSGCLETLEGMHDQDGPYLSMLEAALVSTPVEYKGVSVTFKEQR